MKTIYEPGKHIPIVDEADVCVLGGSCTGVFAAVRAARLGAKVVIIEKQNCFGGVATLGLVNIWHSLYDAEFKSRSFPGSQKKLWSAWKSALQCGKIQTHHPVLSI